MTQHRSVVLLEYVASYFDQAVGTNANEVLVERCVMEFAERKPIWNPRLSTLPVADDVCGIEKFAVLEATDCALCPIGAKNPLAKRALVKANLQFTSGVSASLLPDLIGDGRQCSHWLVEVDNGGIGYRSGGRLIAISRENMGRVAEATEMENWNTCPAVERTPGKVSGAWVFAGTRIPLSALYENLASGATIEDFVEWFPGVDEQQVRTVLEHEARALETAAAP